MTLFTVSSCSLILAIFGGIGTHGMGYEHFSFSFSRITNKEIMKFYYKVSSYSIRRADDPVEVELILRM